MAYEKMHDLWNLAIWMQSTREGVSLNEIAERYGVHRRTAERMRDMIIETFPSQYIEFCDEKNFKRWSLPQGAMKDLIQLNAEEMSVLEFVSGLFEEKQLLDKKEIYQAILEKIKACIKSEVRRKIEPDTEALLESEGYICRPGPKLKIDEKILSDIRQAILSCRQIKITYFFKNKGTEKQNILDPYGFLYGERNHYLIARHSDGYAGNAMRSFILGNIKKVEILDKFYTKASDFSLQSYAEESFGSFHESPVEVEWLFDRETAEEASRYVFHPTQEMIKNDDGTLTVRFCAGGRLEMDWHLYTWGNHVQVIKPENWKEQIASIQK